MKGAFVAALVLVIVGALNWGLIGAFNFNLVTAILGEGTMLTRIVYILVGVAAIVVGATAAPIVKGPMRP